MRDLPIATGNSRTAKHWSNRTVPIDALIDRLSSPIRTIESVSEYARMSKSQRDQAKDHGGFVAGHLSGGRRRGDTVACRAMVTLDGDHVTPEFLESFDLLCPYRCILYSTHSHTPESPRVRLLFPLTRDVSPEEFVAVSRFMAQSLGIEMFDECSYLPNQLMYWPSCPSNGDYLFMDIPGPWLDPDALLGAHPEWTDPTRLPTSSRESHANEPGRQKVQDPLEKDGVVGIFNRVFHPIGRAIETFLSDVYEPTADPARWHLIESSSMPGVEIIEDRFVYSHHAKDPAYLRLCNAFDIVRIHRFGDFDEKASYKEMCRFAMAQDEVRLLAAEEKLRDAETDFADNGNVDREWKKKLRFQSGSDALENSVYNLELILNNDPDFANFAWNELASRVQITGPVPWDRPEGNTWWRDADTAHLRAIVDTRYFPFSNRNYDIVFTRVADLRHFHPIRDRLDALPEWDGIPRVEELFIRYLEADDTPYVRAVTRKTFAAAVARIYRPGTKFDYVPVLDGDQGIGKSSIMKDLVGPDLYSETLSLTDMDDKAGAEKLQGFWIVEIGELAGMKKADIERVKAFISTCDDKYRPSYGRVVESHPRQCVIVATVNGDRGYLRDVSGNRRFWIVKCHRKKSRIPWDFDPDFLDQFWAESKAIWLSGEKLYLESELLAEAESQQRAALEQDDRAGILEKYLDTLLPENWAEMDIYARRRYLHGDELGPGPKDGTVRRNEVSNIEIWCECLCKDAEDLKHMDSTSIASLMNQIPGWKRTGIYRRLPIYGKQRIYQREEVPCPGSA